MVAYAISSSRTKDCRANRDIHVKGGGRDSKIWIEPTVAIAESYGFNSIELARILRVVSGRRGLILRAWNEHFGDGGAI
jgi:hypothetical protein